MKMIKLKNLAEFNVGANQTRINIDGNTLRDVKIYDQRNFDFDLNNIKVTLEENKYLDNYRTNTGNLIFSSISQKIAIVQSENAGKIITNNYILIKPIVEKLDSTFLMYLINESDYIKRQFEKICTGTMVQRIPLNEFKELSVPLMSIEKQKQIGCMYVETLKLQNQLKRYSDLLGELTESVIHTVMKGEQYESV